MLENSAKKHFITFGDSRMTSAASRIHKQAVQINFFDEIYVLNENDLPLDFRNEWAHQMKFGVRGFGYWCWKPYIIRKLLERIPENSIVVYLDIGCHINPRGVERLKYYIDELKNDSLGIKAFPAYSSSLDVMEKRWTKGDIFDYFHCRFRKDITDSLQLATGHILFIKNSKTVEFVKQWESVWKKNFALVDDSMSKSQNFSEFIENRHDQSIFSILYKLHGGTPLPDNETESADYSTMSDYPFWDLRDKGVKDKRFFIRLKKFIRSLFIRARIKKEQLKSAQKNKR